MLIKKITDVPAEAIDSDGAEKTTVRVLFGPADGAPTFAMRQFELDVGGRTPHHTHPFEHQILVLQGQLALVTADGEIPVTVGDVIMILPGEEHQLRNTSKTQPARVICTIPVEYQK